MQKSDLKIATFLFIIISFLLIFLLLYTSCELYTANPTKKENSGEDSKDNTSNNQTSILYVTNRDSDTVTYLDATTGGYINETLENSSFTTGEIPWGIAVNPSTNILYVTNWDSDTITYFNATTGKYLNGNLMNSSFTTGYQLCGIGVKP